MKALQKAREAWGTAIPDWVVALAEACDASSAYRVAQSARLSQASISLVLANKYPHRIDQIAARVRAHIKPATRHEAAAGWGTTPPDWIVALAKACDEAPQTEVARRIEYSPAVVSQVLRNTYKGNLKRVEYQVRGFLMGETVQCPRHYEPFGLHVCVWNQEAHFDKHRRMPGVSERFRKTCPHCPHWLKKKGD